MVFKEKLVLLISIFLLISIIFSFNASAITAKIGNGRMILNVEVGETIERSIRIINDNDIAVGITVFPSGDLESDTEIIDKEFILQAGEEKNARFKIPIKKPGRTETRINVKFNPINSTESGVGLSAQIIVNTISNGEENISVDKNNVSNNNITDLIKDRIFKDNIKIKSVHVTLIISTIVLLILLIVLLKISKKFGKKKGNKGEVKKIKKEVEEK